MKYILSSVLLASLPAFAGLYDQPYSIIETDVAPSADSHMRPVIVNRVDDKNALDGRAVVAPGAHQVTIDLPPRKGFRTATQVTFDLETQACVKYYVVAILDSPTTQTWSPKVRWTESLGECKKKFDIR